MKSKFVCSILFGSIWLFVSSVFAIFWAEEVSHYLPSFYVWWVIIGIALLPGFLMSAMFFSNLLNFKVEKRCNTSKNTTVIICAYNEQNTIGKTIASICRQDYFGHIHIIVADNASTDNTKHEILRTKDFANDKFSIEYLYCEKQGKSHTLNRALELVATEYFITVDADTFLEVNAVQRIMNHIVDERCACVAGNLFVYNARSSIIAKMQIYDYLLCIAAIKRFQGSYKSTLVAQGAFSAYNTVDVRNIGGWKHCLGEDIVLTYQLLEQGKYSGYEPTAAGYTTVPETLSTFYNQRKRWAVGMLEGFSSVNLFHGKCYLKYFTFANISIIYLDLAIFFGFIPGIILAMFGYYYFVGCLTIFAMIISVFMFSSVYFYQKKLNIPFKNSFIGFIFFLPFYQLIQSTAAMQGYFSTLLRRKESWK